MSKDAVLASAWAHFVGTHKTVSNKFFSAISESADDALQYGGEEGSYNIGRQMTDVAIVRLLEVAGYIDFTDAGAFERTASGQTPATKFYETVPRGWTFASSGPEAAAEGEPPGGGAAQPASAAADGGGGDV